MNIVFDPSLVLYLPLPELGGSSLMSRDAYGHLCTVTGALWRPDGRSFDGVDDKVAVPNHSSFAALEVGTLEIWTYNGEPGTNHIAFEYGWSSTNYVRLIFYNTGVVKLEQEIGNVVVTAIASDAPLPAAWNHILVTQNGVAARMYVNGVAQDHSGDINSGNWFADSGINNYITIGDDNWHARFKGTIGELRLYGRCLSSLEAIHNYLATKWRYR